MVAVWRVAGAAGWAGVAFLLGWLAVEYTAYAWAALRWPFGLDYSEGLIWQQALWMPGPHMYGDISHYPFVVFEYPPLYFLAVKAAAAAGLGMLVAGRLVSELAVIAACWLIGAVVWQGCGVRGWAAGLGAVVAGLLPLSLLPVISWSVLMRVDLLALALNYGGIALAVAAFRRPGLLYAAVLLFVAAAFTKQIYLAAAVSMGVVWLVRAPLLTARAYGLGLLLGLALVGGLAWVTHGGFIDHILFYNADRLNAAKAWRATALWLAAYPVFCLLTVLAMGLAWRKLWARRAEMGLLGAIRRDETVAFLGFFTLYTALCTVMLISAGKTGASRNYFLEWMCCWCVWIGVLSAWAIAARGLVLAALLPFALLLQLWPLPPAVAALRAGQFSAAHYAASAALLARLRGLPPGPVLSDDMVALLQSGREVGAEPGILLELAQTGLWDEQLLVGMLERHDFRAVVTAYDPGDPTFDARYLPRTRAAMLANYPVVERYGDYRLRLGR